MNSIRRTSFIIFLICTITFTGCGGSSNYVGKTTGQSQKDPVTNKTDDSKQVLYQLTIQPSMIDTTEQNNVQINADGSITVGKSDAVPHIYEGAQKWAVILTKAIESPQAFKSVDIHLEKVIYNPKDQIQIEVSTSQDAQDWSEFGMMGKDATEYGMIGTANFVKYRISLISYEKEHPPVLKKITIQFKK